MQAGTKIYFYRNQYTHEGIYLTSVWEPVNQFENGKFYLIFPTSYTTSENEIVKLEPSQCYTDYKELELKYKDLLEEENKEFRSVISNYQTKLADGLNLINKIK
jgi:hypothetical protein